VTPDKRGRFFAAKCEEIARDGGAVTVALEAAREAPGEGIGLMVAANSGRPGGAVGLTDRVDHSQVHPNHRTQEEDIMSAWLIGECSSTAERDALFRDTIGGLWGLREAGSTDGETIQGVDYRALASPHGYADAWVVRRAVLCRKSQSPPRFYPTDKFVASLVFVAGPNAGCSGRPTGSTARTLNRRASDERNYEFFRDSVKAALRAGLDAMIEERLTIALVARISCGIYAGCHRGRVNADFVTIVNELLLEPLRLVGSSPRAAPTQRGSFFRRVIVPHLV
jgi:hypothetical protein